MTMRKYNKCQLKETRFLKLIKLLKKRKKRLKVRLMKDKMKFMNSQCRTSLFKKDKT